MGLSFLLLIDCLQLMPTCARCRLPSTTPSQKHLHLSSLRVILKHLLRQMPTTPPYNQQTKPKSNGFYLYSLKQPMRKDQARLTRLRRCARRSYISSTIPPSATSSSSKQLRCNTMVVLMTAPPALHTGLVFLHFSTSTRLLRPLTSIFSRQ